MTVVEARYTAWVSKVIKHFVKAVSEASADEFVCKVLSQ